MTLSSPLQLTYLAFATSQIDKNTHRSHLELLCQQYSLPPLKPTETRFLREIGQVQLEWVEYEDYVTYSFIREGSHRKPFADSALRRMPQDWVKNLPAQPLVTLNIVLETEKAHNRSFVEILESFGVHSIVGSYMLNNTFLVWGDFQLDSRSHEEISGRLLVQELKEAKGKAEHLVQTLLETETHRKLAPLALPIAKTLDPVLKRLEDQLNEISLKLTKAPDVESVKTLLLQFTGKIDHLITTTQGRLLKGAQHGEKALAGLSALDEKKIEGIETVESFMKADLNEVLSIYNALIFRQKELKSRINTMVAATGTPLISSEEIFAKETKPAFNEAKLAFKSVPDFLKAPAPNVPLKISVQAEKTQANIEKGDPLKQVPSFLKAPLPTQPLDSSLKDAAQFSALKSKGEEGRQQTHESSLLSKSAPLFPSTPPLYEETSHKVRQELKTAATYLDRIKAPKEAAREKESSFKAILRQNFFLKWLFIGSVTFFIILLLKIGFENLGTFGLQMSVNRLIIGFIPSILFLLWIMVERTLKEN